MRISDWSSDVCSSDLWVFFLCGRCLPRRFEAAQFDRAAEQAAAFAGEHDALPRQGDDHPAVLLLGIGAGGGLPTRVGDEDAGAVDEFELHAALPVGIVPADRKSTRLNSSH